MNIYTSCPLLGSNRFDTACAFYQALFAETEVRTVLDTHDYHGDTHSMLWVMHKKKPLFIIGNFTANGLAASTANGSMVYLVVADQQEVEAWYQRAIRAGAHDQGAPGVRYQEYAAYFSDLDGHKFCIRTPFA